MNSVETEIKLFQRDLQEFHINLEERQITLFLQYYELLLKWNSFMNLTSITEFPEVIKKHFVDSVSLIKAVPDLTYKPYTLIDVGTGAGFPGIPLKIIFPDLKITLLDSLNKRVQFLREVIDNLELKEIEAIHGRAEDFAKQEGLRESFDLCVFRAVANLSVLAEYCIPFVKQKGFFVAYKGENISEEFENSKNAVKVLGGSFIKQVDFTLPNSDIRRILFLIEKKSATPLKYPRKSGKPSKEPIL